MDIYPFFRYRCGQREQLTQIADLAFLPFETDEARAYYMEMKYCTEFALANRKLMMERIQQVVSATLNSVVYEPMINIAHNYAAWEKHFASDDLPKRFGKNKGGTQSLGGDKRVN